MRGYLPNLGLLVGVFSIAIAPAWAQTRYVAQQIDISAGFVPSAISDTGWIVGYIGVSGGTSYVYNRIDGELIDLRDFASASEIVALDINRHGQVAGYFNRSAQTAFFWDGVSGAIELGTISGDNFSIAAHINDAGSVVGFSAVTNAQPDHAFLWTAAGGMVDLGLPFRGYPNSINEAGVIVGSSYGQPPRIGYVRAPDGTIELIPDLFGGSSEALDINDSGVVVGWSGHYFGPADPWQHAYFFDGSTATDIDSLGNNLSRATSVNDAGLIVGFYHAEADSPNAAFLWREGVMFDLTALVVNAPPLGLTVAVDVNNLGQILAQSYGPSGPAAGFVFVLVPCAHDLNGDGQIDLDDLATLLAHFGTVDPEPGTGDIDGNRIVDLPDLAILLSTLGTTCQP